MEKLFGKENYDFLTSSRAVQLPRRAKSTSWTPRTPRSFIAPKVGAEVQTGLSECTDCNVLTHKQRKDENIKFLCATENNYNYVIFLMIRGAFFSSSVN